VFDGHIAGDFQVFLMNADGSGLIQLTSAAGGSGGPRWSSDGTRIVFGSDRDGNGEIYVADADGSNIVRLTNHAANDTWAAWKRR
jgi:Tol biopolymer transport system component